jgi:demethylmenaquinone methyltransferase/2-methoxy-6-polyprenyl-1,4-benzoquinol methylase
VQGPNADNIKGLFSNIAARYDRANTVLSFGVHHLWRKNLVSKSGLTQDSSILDCATGTGDLAFEFKAHQPTVRVVGTDFCEPMLDQARDKAKQLGVDVPFQTADCQKLPFADGQFDIVSISFGLRNVQEPELAMAEFSRVLKPGGRLMILEFGVDSKTQDSPLLKAFRWYSKVLLPRIGGLVTGRPDAYSYLEKSSGAFLGGQSFVDWAPPPQMDSRASSSCVPMSSQPPISRSASSGTA